MSKADFVVAGCLVFGLSAGAAPIPPEVKSVVACILVEDEKQPGQLRANGTAFFVAIQVPGQVDQSVVYLVTAAHVLQRERGQTNRADEPAKRTEASVWYPHVYVRMNTQDGGSEVAKLPIIGDQRVVLPLVSSDDTVDLAAIRVSPDLKHFDYKMISATMIATKEDFSSLPIREGSDLFLIGLFSPRPGISKHLPILRFGRVAMLPAQKIDWDGRATELVLMETGSFGGNSGSPVFFNLAADREPGAVSVGNPDVKLVGVMQDTSRDLQEGGGVGTRRVPVDPSSLGIAAVVPAYKLRDLLFSDQAKQQRGF